MKTIHITSQDDLPDVAEAVIEALGRRTVVAFRGEMGAGKTTLIREIAAAAGRDGHRNQPHVRHRQPVQGQGRPPHPPFRLLPHQRRPRSLRLRLRRVISIRATSVWSKWPEKIEQLPARQRDDGTHHRGQRHGPHVRDRLTLRACTYVRQHAPLHRAGCRAVPRSAPGGGQFARPAKNHYFCRRQAPEGINSGRPCAEIRFTH